MAGFPDGGRSITGLAAERSLRKADPRSSLAAFLSFLVPGLGQAYNGRLRLALALGLPVMLVVGLAVVAVGSRGPALLTQLLDARFLVGLLVLDAALLGWRLLAIAQAHDDRGRFRLRHWTAWATGGLLIVTVAMHVLPGYYVLKAVDTLNAVSREGSGITRTGGGLPGQPDASPLPEPSDQPSVERGERVNVLLVGVDSGPGRVTSLTDTMLVVSIDPDGGHSMMISVPRDLYGAPLPDGRVYNAKLNSLLAHASSRPEEFPLGGPGTLKAAIGELLGMRIHYFGAINLLGFVQAIDAIGGVDVTVERTIYDPGYRNEWDRRVGFYLPAGRHHLDASTALAFVRSRQGAGDSDFTRAERQQLLLAAIREKLTAGNLVLALPGLLDAVKNAISTDIPASRFPELAAVVQEADMTDLGRIVLQPPTYMRATSDVVAGYILLPDLDAIRTAVRRLARGIDPATEPTFAPTPRP